jgi:hypothetical protein
VIVAWLHRPPIALSMSETVSKRWASTFSNVLMYLICDDCIRLFGSVWLELSTFAPQIGGQFPRSGASSVLCQ